MAIFNSYVKLPEGTFYQQLMKAILQCCFGWKSQRRLQSSLVFIIEQAAAQSPATYELIQKLTGSEITVFP
jgi:hypothetical protein